MKRNNLLILALLQLFVFHGCIEVIDFDTERDGGSIVIDGSVTEGTGPFAIRLRETASTDRITYPVSGALITLFDDAGNSGAYQESADDPGRYILPSGGMTGIPGRAYHVEIEMPNGRIYQSEPETMPRLAGVQDSIYFEFGFKDFLNDIGNPVTKPVVNAYINAAIDQQPGEDLFFKWDVEEVYLLSPTDFPDPFGSIPPPCFVYEYPSGQDFQLFDGRESRSAAVQGLRVATQIVGFNFTEKHYFSVYQIGMTEKAFDYWSKIRQTVANVGTIFDTPPAPVQGNVFNPSDPDETVLGYFGVEARDTIRAYVLPSDLHVTVLKECEYRPWVNDYPDRCLDCLSVPNSTHKRPDFF